MKIVGTGSAVPEQVITNDDLTSFLDTSDEWIRTRTGIESRPIIKDELLEDLAADAAKAALESAGITADKLDYILCSNVYNTYYTPALSAIVQGTIGATCPCMDLNSACAGFIYALQMANGLFCAGGAEYILVFCAEETTRMADWADRATCVLFGDGAAAVVLTASEDTVAFEMGTWSNKEVLFGTNNPGNCPYTERMEPAKYMYMDGGEVYKFAVMQATKDIKKILKKSGTEIADVDYFFLHQANQRIVDGIGKRLKVGAERLPSNIAYHGNTSSASLPILLDEVNRSGQLKQGDTLIFSAFGAGLVTGTCLLQWNCT